MDRGVQTPYGWMHHACAGVAPPQRTSHAKNVLIAIGVGLLLLVALFACAALAPKKSTAPTTSTSSGPGLPRTGAVGYLVPIGSDDAALVFLSEADFDDFGRHPDDRAGNAAIVLRALKAKRGTKAVLLDYSVFAERAEVRIQDGPHTGRKGYVMKRSLVDRL